MVVAEYKGKKNDLIIGLIHRWVLTGDDKTIVITVNKVDEGFDIRQWAMDKDGNDIESDQLLTTPFKKKYYAMEEVNKMIKVYLPSWGEKKVYKRKK